MMVDTERVLEQMRAANPAPSLEQLADDLDQVHDIVARGRFAMTTPVKEQPQTRPDRLTTRRGLRPVLVAGLAFILVLGSLGVGLLLVRGSDGVPATAAFTCPPGSTPDQPGPADQPRPPGGGPMAFDPASGLALMRGGGSLWTFDVCTNTWTTASGVEDIGYVSGFVYDVDSNRAIAFAEDEGMVDVWAYVPATQTWTRKSEWRVVPEWPLLQEVYDPVSGLIVVREPFISVMWTYDVDTDTWTEIDQGVILPPALAQNGPHVELLTYDASVDRLILYVASDGAPKFVLGTWEFDIRAGHWEEQETNTPTEPGLGWAPTGEEFVYDEANQVSVLFASAYLATYDASEQHWTVVPHESYAAAKRFFRVSSHAYDTVNGRVLILGGDGYAEQDPIIAFDVATGEWITLLEPTAE